MPKKDPFSDTIRTVTILARLTPEKRTQFVECTSTLSDLIKPLTKRERTLVLATLLPKDAAAQYSLLTQVAGLLGEEE